MIEIRRLVQENGGIFVQYYSQSAGDFMIASNLPLSKVKKLGNQKVVKASWITERLGVCFLIFGRILALELVDFSLGEIFNSILLLE